MFWLIALVLFTIGFWNIHRYKTTLTHCRQVTAVLSELRYTPPMNDFIVRPIQSSNILWMVLSTRLNINTKPLTVPKLRIASREKDLKKAD